MITRAPRPTSNFYLLDKAISEDKRLSWAARGLLIFLLGKPDNWTVSPAALVNETAGSARSVGRDGVYAILKELKDAGYLRTVGNRSNGGTFAGTDYLVSESPVSDETASDEPPHTDLPDTAEPDTANPTQVSIEKKQGLIGKKAPTPPALKNQTSRTKTLATYLAECKAAGVKPIPEDHHIRGYMKAAGITEEMGQIAWLRFREEHTTGVRKAKRYIDWPGTFANSIKARWYRLWVVNANGEATWTSEGLQEKRAIEAQRKEQH